MTCRAWWLTSPRTRIRVPVFELKSHVDFEQVLLTSSFACWSWHHNFCKWTTQQGIIIKGWMVHKDTNLITPKEVVTSAPGLVDWPDWSHERVDLTLENLQVKSSLLAGVQQARRLSPRTVLISLANHMKHGPRHGTATYYCCDNESNIGWRGRENSGPAEASKQSRTKHCCQIPAKDSIHVPEKPLWF